MIDTAISRRSTFTAFRTGTGAHGGGTSAAKADAPTQSAPASRRMNLKPTMPH